MSAINPNAIDQFISEVKFNSDGLVAAIAQDAESKTVLMMAWMNEESLRLTLAEQQMIYFSRSRKRLWRRVKAQDTHKKSLILPLIVTAIASWRKLSKSAALLVTLGDKTVFISRFPALKAGLKTIQC